MSMIGGIGGGGGGGGGLAEIMALRQQIIARSQALQQVHTGAAAGAGASSASTLAAGTASGVNGTGDFGQALQNALSQVSSSETQANALVTAYDKGQTTDIAKVMLAREQASVGFEGVLQVRNKLLSAYQDIMKLGV